MILMTIKYNFNSASLLLINSSLVVKLIHTWLDLTSRISPHLAFALTCLDLTQIDMPRLAMTWHDLKCLSWLQLQLQLQLQLDLTWLDLTWLDLTRHGLTCLDFVLPSTWLDLTCLNLTCLNLTCLDLAWDEGIFYFCESTVADKGIVFSKRAKGTNKEILFSIRFDADDRIVFFCKRFFLMKETFCLRDPKTPIKGSFSSTEEITHTTIYTYYNLVCHRSYNRRCRRIR